MRPRGRDFLEFVILIKPMFGFPAFVFALLFASLATIAPAAAQDDAGVQFPSGLSIGIVPPEGMFPAIEFLGFEDRRTGAAITIFELPADAFERVVADFTDENLREQGFIDPQSEEVSVEGAREALLITGEQDLGRLVISKTILIAAGEERTALVVAERISDSARYDDAMMRDALMTVSFRPPPSLEELIEALPFRVGDLAGFRPVGVVANASVVLTDGPLDDSPDLAQPILLVANVPGGAIPSDQRDAFARQALFAIQDVRDIRVERSESFRQRNAEWHEVLARARTETGQDAVVIQTFRFTTDGLIRVVGLAREEERSQWLPRFRRLIDSVDPR
ncbi:MAG: hypothetical protein EA385_11745 [Salinarimonadaceae bacterium]|nr:MAG: hypothetical protein EA385_11745 [Salinarimonadaceae bacterium]